MHGHARRPEPEAVALRLRVHRGPQRALVQVCGEVDMVTADQLRAALHRLREQGCRTVELDLSGVTFLAAAGLSVLVEHDRGLRAAAGRLLVVRPSRRCARMLALTGLDQVLTVR
jgi:anti-sigma B factor antagonist